MTTISPFPRPLSALSRIELVGLATSLQGRLDEVALPALRRAEVAMRAECHYTAGLESWKAIHGAIVSLGGTTQ